jgi:protein-tyrosine phosphatase
MRLTGAIRLPDGCWVRGRGLRDPLPDGAQPDFGLYLGSSAWRRKHEPGLTWPHLWVDWPDFRLPRDDADAIHKIRVLHEHALQGEQVEVACGAGIGRTGTVIACMAVLAGVPAADAVEWTRANHHPMACETGGQRRWVARFAKAAKDSPPGQESS